MSGTVFAERLKRSCDRNDMKKIFTVDDLMVAVIAALGYGFGYSLAKRCGWPEAVCVAACLALGMALEEATGRIIFSKAIPCSSAIIIASAFSDLSIFRMFPAEKLIRML